MGAGLEVVVIADDLTGAADTGVLFAAAGSPVYLMPAESLSLDRPWMNAAGGASVYTASRDLSARAAAERVRSVASKLTAQRPRWIYKKIDSCLRGNLGAEIDVLLDVLGLDAALVAPALPAQGRTTVGGIHRVHGVPLAETEIARDPVTPVNCSVVSEILARQSRYTIGRVGFCESDNHPLLERTVERERDRGCRLIVCDAVTQEHLDRIAALLVHTPSRLLPVGSAGLASSMARRLSFEGVAKRPPVPVFRRLLMVCGTASQVTRKQLDLMLERYPGNRRELGPEWLVAASQQDRARLVNELHNAWTGGVLALTIGSLRPEGSSVDPGRAVAGLAELASEMIRGNRENGLCLFLSGGETADAFRRATRGEAIALEPELLPGVVLGRWQGGLADRLPVVTKPGGFGQERTLVALYERLNEGAGL